MERREAIKSISAVLGYGLSPALISGLAASCSRSRKMSDWIPNFFSKEDAPIIEALGEAFLPKTSTPGSRDVKAHYFVDIFLDKVAKPKDREIFKKGLEIWKNAFEDRAGMPLANADHSAYVTNLSSYYNINEEEQVAVQKLMNEDEPIEQSEKEKYRVYSFLKLFKRLIMLGFYVSEDIGENVLSYLPVPGDYEGCIPVESIGNAWSLG